MSSLSLFFRRGGPLQGPKLLLALFAIVLIFFYLSQPYTPPQKSAGIPRPPQHEGPKSPMELAVPAASVVPTQEKDEGNSMSDKLFDYLKGHSTHGHKSHSPVPHAEAAPELQTPISTASNSTDPFCSHLPSTDDLLIVVRTPASEIYNQLPAHFFTTLRCAQFLLYSTVSQSIGPYTVYDALANISDSRRSKHKDFELYDKLQNAQNAVQDMSHLKEDKEHNLDKWAIIPHVIAAYKMHPRKKWFLFIESDTYISLSNTLNWINQLDSSKPLFAGAQVMIGDVELAHSGSGIIMSGAAVEQLVDVSKKRMDAWEDKVGNSCCGDKILAEALKEANITLHRSFPMIQGETPFSLDWSKGHWCRSALTWHRMNPATLDMLWQFERDWVNKHSSEVNTQVDNIPPMLFKDFFQMFFVPLIRASQNRSDWDNLSDSLTYDDSSRAQYAHFSFDACRAACDLRESCVQYAWEPNKCRLGNVVRLGDAVNSDKRMKSGWLPHRVEKFGEKVGSCEAEEAFIMPDPEKEAVVRKEWARMKEKDLAAKKEEAAKKEMEEAAKKEKEEIAKKEEAAKKEASKDGKKEDKKEDQKKDKKEDSPKEEKKDEKKDESSKDEKKDESSKDEKKDESSKEEKKDDKKEDPPKESPKEDKKDDHKPEDKKDESPKEEKKDEPPKEKTEEEKKAEANLWTEIKAPGSS